jgi:Ni/Fe-hydrogenase 1 B-type cytochrome subunit
VSFWSTIFWSEVWFEICWYLFLTKERKKYAGHTPLAPLETIFFITLTLGVSFVIVHIYVAIREGITSRQSIVSKMNSGMQNFKDERGE